MCCHPPRQPGCPVPNPLKNYGVSLLSVFYGHLHAPSAAHVGADCATEQPTQQMGSPSEAWDCPKPMAWWAASRVGCLRLHHRRETCPPRLRKGSPGQAQDCNRAFLGHRWSAPFLAKCPAACLPQVHECHACLGTLPPLWFSSPAAEPHSARGLAKNVRVCCQPAAD